LCSFGDVVKSLDSLVDSVANAAPAMSDEVLTCRVRIAAWCFLPLAGLLDAIASRHAMQDDGINYLDMGDAMVRGDWKAAVNGVWSPLYPLVQGVALRIVHPSSYSQFTVVHLVNFLIYVFALVGFDFFLRATVAELPRVGGVDGETSRLPKWAVFALGYAVFLWSSLSLIGMQLVIPDMLMAGLLYFAMGLLLRIWAQPQSFSRFILLGVVLGLGYLAKAPMFPIALVIFAMAWMVAGEWRKATPRMLVAVLVFLAVSGPWIIGLSQAKGRFMFGDSARFNYVHHVNGAGADGYFQDLGTAGGHYKHTVRKIFDSPTVFEFARPIKATSPTGYDPSYWSEGAVPRVRVRRQLAVIRHWLGFYLDNFLDSQTALFVGFVVLSFIAGRKFFMGQLAARWPVWLIGLLGLGMYALVHAELRYIAVFLTLFWVGLFSGLEVPAGIVGRRLAGAVALAVVIAMVSPAALSAGAHFRRALQSQPNNQWQVAEDLQRMGVQPGDRVGRFPAHFGLAWARLLKAMVVAQIPPDSQAQFWCGKPETQAQVIDKFRGLGVTAIVAEKISTDARCGPGPAWQKVGDGAYYALKLDQNGAK
jgi:hypothetical protein